MKAGKPLEPERDSTASAADRRTPAPAPPQVDDALPRLTQWGLVTTDGMVRFNPLRRGDVFLAWPGLGGPGDGRGVPPLLGAVGPPLFREFRPFQGSKPPAHGPCYRAPPPPPPQDILTAVPLPEAIETLGAAWSIAYKALGRGRGNAIPAADLLSGRASTFGAGLEAYRQSKAKAAAAEAVAAEGKGGMFGRTKTRLAASFGGAPRAADGAAGPSASASALASASSAALSVAEREGSVSAASAAGDGRKARPSFFRKMSKAARDLLD